MTNAITIKENPELDEALDLLILTGNLADLSPRQQAVVYRERCRDMGLSAISHPLDYISYQDGKTGKTTTKLYVNDLGASQLAIQHQLSSAFTAPEIDRAAGTVRVKCRVTDPWGRSAEDEGQVGIMSKEGKLYTGDYYANRVMHCHTKAHRRAVGKFTGFAPAADYHSPGAVIERPPSPAIADLQAGDKALPAGPETVDMAAVQDAVDAAQPATAADYTAAARQLVANGASKEDKFELHQRATAAGLVWHTGAREYRDPEQPAPPETCGDCARPLVPGETETCFNCQLQGEQE